jgi:hypothetical protein
MVHLAPLLIAQIWWVLYRFVINRTIVRNFERFGGPLGGLVAWLKGRVVKAGFESFLEALNERMAFALKSSGGSGTARTMPDSHPQVS